MGAKNPNLIGFSAPHTTKKLDTNKKTATSPIKPIFLKFNIKYLLKILIF
jgi:hypothetical protein